jgi:addiction module HigA family antidote
LTKKPKTAVSVLKSLLKELKMTPSTFSKLIGLSDLEIHEIIKGKLRITTPIALRFSRFFGKNHAFWLELQYIADLHDAVKDQELMNEIINIPTVNDITILNTEQIKNTIGIIDKVNSLIREWWYIDGIKEAMETPNGKTIFIVNNEIKKSNLKR